MREIGFNGIAAQVCSQGGSATVGMAMLLRAAGARALGPHVRQEICHGLRRCGLHRFPQPLPNCYRHVLTLWDPGTDAGCAFELALDEAGRSRVRRLLEPPRGAGLGSVAAEVSKGGGWAPSTAGAIRDAVGAYALGAKIRQKLESRLDGLGLGWWPEGSFPDDQKQPLILFDVRTEAGSWFVDANETLRRHRAGLALSRSA